MHLHPRTRQHERVIAYAEKDRHKRLLTAHSPAIGQQASAERGEGEEGVRCRHTNIGIANTGKQGPTLLGQQGTQCEPATGGEGQESLA